MAEKLTPQELINKREEMKNLDSDQFKKFSEEQKSNTVPVKSAFDFSGDIPVASFSENNEETEKEEAQSVPQVNDSFEYVAPVTQKHNDVRKVSSIPSFTVIKELPSRGLSYPAGCEISYRPYSFGEAKKLSQSKFSLKEHIDFVLNGVQCHGLKSKYDLTYSDFLFISLLRRISTVQTKTISITFQCRHCKANNTYQINVGDMEFQDSELPKLPIKVNIRGKELKFTYFTLAKFIEAHNHNAIKDEMALLAYSVTNLPFKEAYSIITDENLPYDDGAVLDVVEEQLFHGLNPKEFVCQKGDCGMTNVVNLEILNMTISPFRGDENTYRDRIHYGD